MGTDIHGFWEVYTPEEKWVAFQALDVGRDYTWFGIAAGVRYAYWPDEESIPTWDRGVPRDSSISWNSYLSKYNNSGLHSTTYLYPDEVALINRFESDFRDGDPNHPFVIVPTELEWVEDILLDFPDNSWEIRKQPCRKLLKDLIHPSKNFQNGVRLVIGFDS